MEVIYLLIPIALLLVIVIVAIFFWAIRSGQFDDMEGPAHRILMDDDEIHAERGESSKEQENEKELRQDLHD
ncbi:MAG: cbb3-type cytochrome oxidase assembly protein CcoS [Granulosicoccaceae bacterium]|jgi:cbb3-type cytochrome oxidase maturation protein